MLCAFFTSYKSPPAIRLSSSLIAFQALLTEKTTKKVWHYNKVNVKDLAEGDLVLKFTTKWHKKKLKLQEEGPYITSTITKTGCVNCAHMMEPTSQLSSTGVSSNANLAIENLHARSLARWRAMWYGFQIKGIQSLHDPIGNRSPPCTVKAQTTRRAPLNCHCDTDQLQNPNVPSAMHDQQFTSPSSTFLSSTCGNA